LKNSSFSFLFLLADIHSNVRRGTFEEIIPQRRVIRQARSAIERFLRFILSI
jgi:hypothetical protein